MKNENNENENKKEWAGWNPLAMSIDEFSNPDETSKVFESFKGLAAAAGNTTQDFATFSKAYSNQPHTNDYTFTTGTGKGTGSDPWTEFKSVLIHSFNIDGEFRLADPRHFTLGEVLEAIQEQITSRDILIAQLLEERKNSNEE